jgi:spermidine/putrescine transport system ATP-binding protein
MALLEIRNVTRRFGALEALKNVSLAVEAGEFFTLLGPSGCGKTTLLRLIAGFDEPDEGTLYLDGVPLAGVPAERRPVHTVFQSYALFPHMTVEGNVAFPLKMAGKSPADIRRLTEEVLDAVHLSDKAGAYPHELSGGQKQRVALARGLVNKPRLLLLDEPLGALDAKLRVEMQIDLIKLQKEVGVTFVFVTHAQQEALALSHRIAVMNEGRVEQVDEPDRLYSLPKNRFVADFIGVINLADCQVKAVAPEGLVLDAGPLGELLTPPVPGVEPGCRGAFALRPEQVRIHGAAVAQSLPNRLTGRVFDFLYIGDVTTYHVDLDRAFGGGRFKALRPNNASGRAKFFEPGDPVALEWPRDAGLFLPEA